jgi:SAM-dependent methyltransferase
MARIRATAQDLVLDVGSGGHPHSTSDILVERFLEDTEGHRRIAHAVRNRPLVCADIHSLPFKDKAFDYVICNQVIEHVDDPAAALNELARVGRRGFLSVPSEFMEFICPVPTHRWVFALQGRTLLMKPKSDRHRIAEASYGGVFWELQKQVDFRRLMLRRPRLFFVELEWEDSIELRCIDGDERPFIDYLDPSAFGDLLRPVPPDSLHDAVRRWIRIGLDIDQAYHLTNLRRWVRQLLKTVPVVRR